MSPTDQALQTFENGVPKRLSWARSLRLNIGMSLLGGGAGLSFPFAADVITLGAASQGLSLVGLLCAVPMMAAGAALTVSALGLKPHLDIFRRR
jgi:hypothetical protein